MSLAVAGGRVCRLVYRCDLPVTRWSPLELPSRPLLCAFALVLNNNELLCWSDYTMSGWIDLLHTRSPDYCSINIQSPACITMNRLLSSIYSSIYYRLLRPVLYHFETYIWVGIRPIAAVGALLFGLLSAAQTNAQTLPCNYRTLTTNNYSTAFIVNGRTGGTGGFLGIGAGNVTNEARVIDADLNNFASINTTLTLASGGEISVDAGGTVVFGAGATAGYVVGGSSGFGSNLLGSVTIVTYLNGTEQERSNSSSLLDLVLLSGSGRRTLGFVTTKNFDEVQIRVSSLVSLLTSLPVYYPFVQYRTLGATATATSASGSTTADGSVALAVTGGRSPFTYLWSNGATTANLTNVLPGTYSVTVTDANGCTITASATVGIKVAACPVPGQNGFTVFTFTSPTSNTGTGANKLARYSNVATLNGQSIDMIADVLSYTSSNGTLSTTVPVNFSSVGTQAQFLLYGSNSTATVRWTAVKSGTNIPVPFQASFTVGDLDRITTSGATRLEGIEVQKSELYSYKLNTPTNTSLITGASFVRFQGTIEQGSGSSPQFAVALSFVGVSSFDIVYTKNGTETNTQAAGFTFDGNGSIVFDATTACVPVLDTDGDSVANANDVDDDNDGILDDTEGGNLVDTDEDGVANLLDLDSDGDGIPDNIEAQTTVGYIAPGTVVNPLSGLLTAYASTNGLIPINTDGADTADYLDLDSDNDTRTDTIEAGITLANADADNDGLDNAPDTNDAGFGPVNAGISTPLTFYPNNDTEVLWRVKRGAFTYGNCALASFSGQFVVGIPSSGVLTIPISTSIDGAITITSVTGAGINSNPLSVTSILIAGQTTLSIPITYDGSGLIGGRTLTVTSADATGSCQPVAQVIGLADLTTSIGTPSPTLVGGQTSSLPISVSNIGSAATTGPITTTLTLPANVTAPATFTSNGFGCTTTGNSVSCTSSATLANASSTTFAVPITPALATVGTTLSFTNTAITTEEISFTNNTGTSSALVTGSPDLVVAIGQPSPALIVAQTSTIPVSVSNVGNIPTTGPITVTLTIPASVTAPATFTSNGFGCSTSGETITCSNAGPIANAASLTFGVPVTPLSAALGTTPTFSGLVATTGDIITANNSATMMVNTAVACAVGSAIPILK